MKRLLVWVAPISMTMVCLLAVGGRTASVYAQQPRSWTPPVQISEGVLDESRTPGRMSHSIVVADEWGGVHALWSAVFDPDVPIGDTLFYSFWNGVLWSPPVDVLYTPTAPIWAPKAAVDSKGWLHLTWTDNPTGQIWYTRAAVSEAGSPLGWAEPIQLADGLASGLSLAVDSDDTLHLIYCQAGQFQGVYHTSSGDGQTWSTPAYVGQVADSPMEFLECRLGQAEDTQGRLHAVWGQSLLQDTPIYYSRSEDGGASWRAPLEVDRKDDRYEGLYTPGRPNIVAVGRDEVHIVWFGAPSGQRWHQWSADGGNTWSLAEQLSPALRGFMEPPALAADSSGTVHLLSMGWLEIEDPNRPSGLFYTHWSDGRWSPFEYIDTPTELGAEDSQGGGGEYAALAISGGNTLHAVWELGLKEIWSSSLQTDAPPRTPLPTPIPQGTSVAPGTASTEQVSIPTPTHAQATPFVTEAELQPNNMSDNQGSTWQAVLIGALPAAMLVGLASVFHWLRKYR